LINGLSLSLDVPFVAVNAMVGPVLVALAWSRHVIPRPWDDRAAGGGRLHRLRRDVLGRWAGRAAGARADAGRCAPCPGDGGRRVPRERPTRPMCPAPV